MALCMYCKSFLALLGHPYTGDFSHQPSFDALRLSRIECEMCNSFMVSFHQEDNMELIALKEKQGHPTAITIHGLSGSGFIYFPTMEWTDLEQIHVLCGYIGNDSQEVRCVFALYSDDGMYSDDSSYHFYSIYFFCISSLLYSI
jgi:hypothetical protein